MGMPALQHEEWTAERARALPEDANRYEVLDGELFVTPSPASLHQAVVEEIFVQLHDFLKVEKRGRVRISPADIEFSPRRLVQPDVYVIPWTQYPPREWREITSLLLVVEVLSPSTARADRHRKRVIYQSEGVPEYWILDPDARIVERWRPADTRPEIIADRLVWTPAPDRPSLEIDLPAFFDACLGPVDEPQ